MELPNIVKRILDPVTQVVDGQKLNDEARNFKQSESDTDLARRIRERFDAMKTHRDRSCPQFLGNSGSMTQSIDEMGEINTRTADSKDGYSWVKMWQRCYDLYSMKTGKNFIDADLNAISSPVVYSTVQAILAQFQDANTIGSYSPQAGVSETYARIAEFWQRNWEDKTNALKTIKEPIFLEMSICGSAVSHNAHIRKARTVNKMLTPEEVLIEYLRSTMDPALFDARKEEIESNPDEFFDEEGLESLKKEIAKNPKKYLTKKELIIDFDDFYSEHVPIEEFYVDPNALSLNGISRDAHDCIWAYSMSFQELIQTYNDSEDPFVNKSKINGGILKNASHISEYDTINDENEVDGRYEVSILKYYNKYTDEYIILANDVVIRRGPLPYNHKLLPFSIFKFIPVKNSFYGVGIGTLLDNIQSRDELYTAIQDYITLNNANLPGTYTDESGDLEAQLTDIAESKKPIKAGQWFKIGKGDQMNRMTPIIDNGDIQRRRAELDEAATKISMVSPLMVGQMKRNTAVRNNQILQESSLLGIRAIISNFGFGYGDLLFQALHIIKQTATTSYAESQDVVRSGQGANKQALKKYRTIPLDGYTVEEIDGDFKLTPQDGKSEFELTPKVLDSFDKLRVSIQIESSALASKALQAQELQDTMALVMNIQANPMLAENRLIQEMLKQYLSKKNMDPKIMSLLKDDESDESEALALYQNEHMKTGNDEPPIPGMSEGHLLIHAQLLMELVMMREEAMLEMESTIDPMTGTPDPSVQANVDQLTQLIRTVQKHLSGDMQMRSNTAQTAIVMAGQDQPPQMPVDSAAQAMAGQGTEPPPEQMPMEQMPPQGAM